MFLGKEAVGALEAGEKDAFFTQTSQLNMRSLRLTKKLLSFANQLSISLAPHEKRKRKDLSKPVGSQPEILFDPTLKDIELNLRLPPNKQYAEIGLWKTITKLNLQIHKEMGHLEKRHAEKVRQA